VLLNARFHLEVASLILSLLTFTELLGTTRITLPNMQEVWSDLWLFMARRLYHMILVSNENEVIFSFPMEANIDFSDLGPILLTDHYHREYFSIVKDVMGTDPNKIVS